MRARAEHPTESRQAAQEGRRDYVVVGTKVSRDAYGRLQRLAKAKGMSLYELNQMVLDTLIRYMDSSHNLSPDLEAAMAVFEHLEGWPSHNVTDPVHAPEVTAAIYFTTSERGGVRAHLVERPWMGMWRQTENIQAIVEYAIEAAMPQRYTRLRAVAQGRGCASIFQLLDEIIVDEQREADAQAIREGFEDADRSEWGRKPATAPYRRKRHRTMEEIDRQGSGQLVMSAEQLWGLEDADGPDEDEGDSPDEDGDAEDAWARIEG